MHSPKFEYVKQMWDEHRWPLNWVRNAVGRWITAEEYKEITGSDY